MTLEHAGQAVAALAALAGLFAVLWKGIALPLYRLFHAVSDFLDDWNGTPERPGSPRRPGAMERLQQLENNGGTSVKDVVDRTSASVEHLNAKVDALHQDKRNQWAVIRRLQKYHERDIEPDEEESHT